MKSNNKKKEKSPIEILREIRDKINLEIQDMTPGQLKKYIDERSTLHPKSVWEKNKQ